MFDPISLGLTFYLPIALLIDTAMDTRNGVTQKPCPTCGGHGFCRVPD